MKLAIMQPYLFPYIGYFQLINAVDKFVFYDDVNFIKHGWINRNNLLLNEKAFMFTVPVEKVSSFRRIKDTKINKTNFEKSKAKILKTIESAYKKAPYFDETFGIVFNVFCLKSCYIAEYAKESILSTLNYLNIKTKTIDSSEKYNNSDLVGINRVISICKKEYADSYINPIGGIELYDKNSFKEKRITLSFIKQGKVVYSQFGNNFVANLSIIDVLMFNNKNEVHDLLNNYVLI